MSDVALAVARGLEMAAVLSLFGTLTFRLAVLPAVLGRADRALVARLERRLGRLGWISLVLALALALVWLAMEAAAMADTVGAAALAAAAPVVALHTRFGHFILLRLALLAAAGACLGRVGWRLGGAAVLAGVAAALQAGIGHAAAMGSGAIVASDVLHLLAAGSWLGGLLPLFLAIGVLPPALAASAARRFSPLGTLAVLVLAATALVQGISLIGSFPALLGTPYGRVALAKLVLFGLLLALASLNRFAFSNSLLGGDPARARSRLRRSIALETGLGLLVVLAAGLLAMLEPGIDARMAGAPPGGAGSHVSQLQSAANAIARRAIVLPT